MMSSFFTMKWAPNEVDDTRTMPLINAKQEQEAQNKLRSDTMQLEKSQEQETRNKLRIDTIQLEKRYWDEVIPVLKPCPPLSFVDRVFIKAANDGETEVALYMINRHGASPHANNDEAIRKAVCNGHYEVVIELLKLPQFKDLPVYQYYYYFLRYADLNGHERLVKYFTPNKANDVGVFIHQRWELMHEVLTYIMREWDEEEKRKRVPRPLPGSP